MTDRLPLVLVDTCVLVEYLVGNDPALFRNASAVMNAHEETHIVLLPSIVIAEVAGAGQVNGDHGGQEARLERLRNVEMWLVERRYAVADLSERIARNANKLSEMHKLKGADAAVLATALQWECSVLYTEDNNLLKVNGVYPQLPIVKPPDAPSDQGLGEPDDVVPRLFEV